MEAGNLLVPGLEEGAVGNWAVMPTDVVREIAGCIQGIEDYVTFASVCKSWRSSLFFSRWECPKSSKRRLEYPWLMLVEQQQQGEEEECVNKKRGFYSLYSGKQLNLDLPESCGRACFGSSCGWLVTLGLDLNMHLLNPITRQQLPLPSQTTLTDQYSPEYSAPEYLRDVFIHRVLVIYDGPVNETGDHPTPLVFLIYSQCYRLAMARPGDSSWTPVRDSSLRGFFDVSLVRDQVIVYSKNRFWICHFSESPQRFEDLCAQPHIPAGYYDCYVVDLGGELHALFYELKSSLNDNCTVKMRFTAYRLNLVAKTWEEVDTLGGWAVFVGRNSSFSLLCSDYPQCRPNCIYFTDDNIANFDRCGGCDWGIYYYENRSKDTVSDESEVEKGIGCESEGSESEGSESEYIPDNPDEISKNPFPISHEQFSTYSPVLWVAPNLWTRL